jgi:hypothetical protein
MSEPELLACLVCDSARSEAGSKTTLLGLYGLLPNVEIRLADPSVPLRELAFVVITGPISGSTSTQHDISFKLKSTDHETIFDAPVQKISMKGATRGNTFALGVANVKFPKLRMYNFDFYASTPSLEVGSFL